MPAFNLNDEAVIHLARQMSPAAKETLLNILLAERDDWTKETQPSDSEMRKFAGARGLNWDKLSPAAREQVRDELWYEP